ncbi:MAG: Gfo/Idh/MocA family oxidoreductase [Oscillospiraceae bacterium]|nr:Gfo/Idh/MocA family oxidoreductase [Oscillospiraceae bacterium]
MNTYKITVIGAGDRGTTYMSMLKNHYADRVEWSTVCDILPDRMAKAAVEFGFSKQEANWEKAILDSRPDIVIIAAPAYYHCDMAIFAMRCGCHVLSEKPMDLSLAKCFALKECMEQTGKVLAVGMQYRNVHYYRALWNAFEQDLFGDNLMVQWTDIRETRPKIAMHDALYGNGGPMVDMSCHLFDLMRLYFKSDPVSVNCRWRSNAKDRPTLASIGTKAADACFMTVEYENGSLGEIMMNWGLPSGVNGGLFVTATGKDALIMPSVIPYQPPIEVITDGGSIVKVSCAPEDAADLFDAEGAVMRHFLDEIEGKGKSQVSIDHGILCLAASMAALRSGTLGRPVTLEEIYKLRPTVVECMQAKE